MRDPAARLAVVRPAVPLDLGGAVLVESWSNDAWLAGGSVLRVCWRGDRERLLREALILQSLPDSVPHAVMRAAGRTGELTWMVVDRIPGERLDLAWPRLSAGQRRTAVTDVANMLRTLHEWVPPADVRNQLQLASAVRPGTRDGIIGATIVPLPADRLAPLLDSIAGLEGLPADVADGVRQRAAQLLPAVPGRDFDGGVVTHGDAHLANAWWHEGRVVALLDLEWARMGPSDLELEAVCRDNPDIEAQISSGPVPASAVLVLRWLRAAYPALFERANLTERLWLYQFCHQIRQVCLSGSPSIDAQAVRRLRKLAAEPLVRFS